MKMMKSRTFNFFSWIVVVGLFLAVLTVMIEQKSCQLAKIQQEASKDALILIDLELHTMYVDNWHSDRPECDGTSSVAHCQIKVIVEGSSRSIDNIIRYQHYTFYVEWFKNKDNGEVDMRLHTRTYPIGKS